MRALKILAIAAAIYPLLAWWIRRGRKRGA